MNTISIDYDDIFKCLCGSQYNKKGIEESKKMLHGYSETLFDKRNKDNYTILKQT